MRPRTWVGRRAAMAASVIFATGLLLGQLAAQAQEAAEPATEEQAPTAAAEAAEPDTELTEVEGGLSAEELQALVAPIALYPDLVLMLTLQASLAPLDIVQADRFLARYAEDPSLAPDPDWDESVIGLLNYPTVVRAMSDDLEWTDSLGTAVITQLEGVQDAIQEFRAFMRAIGALESNEQATVIAEGDIIRIEPADENAVFIPQYDPETLLAALYSTAPEGETVASEEIVGHEVVTGTQGGPIEEQAPVAESAPVETAAPVQDTGAVAEPAPVVVPAAAPAYYPPPPVTYSDPSPSWLGTAATFAGGAVVGGLVGWAIADDDDDDHDGGNYSRGNIDIEDSTITINRRNGDDLEDLQRRVQDERGDRQALQQAQREQTKLKVQNEHLKREARQQEQRAEAKRQLEQRYPEKQTRTAAAGGANKVSGLAASGSERRTVGRESAGGQQIAARVDQAKAKADPGRRPAAKAAPAKGSKAVRAGDRKQPKVASAFGGTKKSATQAKRDSDRGVKSRSRAITEVKPNRSRNGSSAFAQPRGDGEKRAANNSGGRKSRRGGR